MNSFNSAATKLCPPHSVHVVCRPLACELRQGYVGPLLLLKDWWGGFELKDDGQSWLLLYQSALRQPVLALTASKCSSAASPKQMSLLQFRGSGTAKQHYLGKLTLTLTSYLGSSPVRQTSIQFLNRNAKTVPIHRHRPPTAKFTSIAESL